MAIKNLYIIMKFSKKKKQGNTKRSLNEKQIDAAFVFEYAKILLKPFYNKKNSVQYAHSKYIVPLNLSV